METFNDVINADHLVLVDFYATWCQPCKMMHPILEKVKELVGDKVRIIKVDIDRHPEVASQLHVQAVPTLMLWCSGQLLWHSSGAISRADLMATLDPFLK